MDQRVSEETTDPRLDTDSATTTLTVTERRNTQIPRVSSLPALHNVNSPNSRMGIPPDSVIPQASLVENQNLSMENAFANMAATFAKALEQITQKHTQAERARISPTFWFSGQDHEDPLVFIRQMDAHFLKADIKDESDKLRIATGQLREEARRWYEPYRNMVFYYEAFVDKLYARFNSPSSITEAKSKLYGEKQGATESTELFITRKHCLFNRLEPNTNEYLIAATIMDQLKPNVRSRIRGSIIRSVGELIRVALQVEKDVLEENKFNWRNSTRSRDDLINSANARVNTSRPTLNNQNNGNFRANQNNGNYRANQNNLTTTDNHNTNGTPPSPCRYCNEWHFNRDCPVNPYRNNSSENLRRVGETTRRSDNTARNTTTQPQQTATRRNQPVQRMEEVPVQTPSETSQ